MSRVVKISMPTSEKNHYQEEATTKVPDFDWALGLNRLSLRLMGVWPDDDRLEHESLDIRLRIPFMILIMFLGLFLPQMYALILVIKELPLVINNLMTSYSTLICCIKLFFLWRSKRVLQPVIQSITEDWIRDKRDWELEAMVREATRARLFTISGYVVLAACYSGFAFAPLFGLNVRLISNITDYGDRFLSVQSYFPYDYSKSPNYEFTQASQLLGGFFVGMSVSIPDNYFGALVFHTSAQFEILGIDIENFIKEDGTKLRYSNNRIFSRKLGRFVNRHVHLMAMVTAVEHSFSFVLMAQIFSMSAMVCFLGFLILAMFENSEDRSSYIQMLTLISTLITFMMHTYVNCFASETLASRFVYINRIHFMKMRAILIFLITAYSLIQAFSLLYQSSGIFYNVYKSKWYLSSSQNTRQLIPMMLLSIHPRQILVGKMFNMSLATYCNILKTTAGYISMLIAVNKRQLL